VPEQSAEAGGHPLVAGPRQTVHFGNELGAFLMPGIEGVRLLSVETLDITRPESDRLAAARRDTHAFER
jgi:hypothetical protein